jgi:hypothetical protein
MLPRIAKTSQVHLNGMIPTIVSCSVIHPEVGFRVSSCSYRFYFQSGWDAPTDLDDFKRCPQHTVKRPDGSASNYILQNPFIRASFIKDQYLPKYRPRCRSAVIRLSPPSISIFHPASFLFLTAHMGKKRVKRPAKGMFVADVLKLNIQYLMPFRFAVFAFSTVKLPLLTHIFYDAFQSKTCSF